jgi:hypothetical protein
LRAKLEEELRFHLDRQIEKYIQAGLTREEATRRARLEFGGVDLVEEFRKMLSRAPPCRFA